VGGNISLNAGGPSGQILLGNATLDVNGGTGGRGGMGGYGFDGGEGGFGVGGAGGNGGRGRGILVFSCSAVLWVFGFCGSFGFGCSGGVGGDISVTYSGSSVGGIFMDGGTILARGGAGGGGGAAGYGEYGGYAGVQGLGGNGGGFGYLPPVGSISLNSTGIIDLRNSSLDAGGGHGGGYWFGGNGGHGGNGGDVYVQGASIVANGVDFVARGGNGGSGDAYALTDGGSGGAGGYVGLVATAGGISLTGSTIDASGGQGGWGADSVYIPGWGGYGTTSGGNGGNGGYVDASASGAVQFTSSILLANGGGGGNGGNDLTGYSIGGNGGNGGNGGHMWIGGSSIAMTGSSIHAFGGWGGAGGNGFATYGGTAIYTVTDHWGEEICGGGGPACDGTQLTDSLGVPLFFSPVDGSGMATAGGSGGNGGSVYGSTAIWMNATAGNISMSSDSSIYASPGSGGPSGLGWYGGAVAYYYPSYPSSYTQQISWSGISGDFNDWSANGYGGTPGTVSLNATGSISLGTVNAWDGTVNVTAGGAIIDNNGGGAVNISAQHATLISTYGGTAGSLAISAGTEVYGNLVATVTGGAYGGIDIANSWYQQPLSVNLTDNATSGSATFRQKFTVPTGILSDTGITLIAQPGGFVGLSSNRDLNFALGGTGFFTAGGGGTIGFAANNGTLNINRALAGGTDSVELSAGTLNISAAVSGANITLDGTTTNVNAATTATGYLDIFGGTVNVNAAMQGQNVLLGVNTLNIGNLSGTGGIYAVNHMLAIVTGDTNITGGYLKTRDADLELLVGGDLKVGNASYGGMIYAGYLQPPPTPPAVYADASIAVGGKLKLTNGGYIAAANDIYLDMLGSGSTVEMSSGGGSPAYILSDAGIGVSGTTFVTFAARSSGGIIIDGMETTENGVGASGFFSPNLLTPGGVKVAYASTGANDLCAISPTLCRGPDTDPNPPPPPSKPKDKKATCEEGSFGCEEDHANDGKKDEKPGQKQVAQCSM